MALAIRPVQALWFALILSLPSVAGDIMIVTTAGVWQVSVGADGIPSATKALPFNADDQIIFAIGNIDKPLPPSNGTLAEKVASISKATLANAKEAEGMAVIIRTIRDLDTDAEQAKTIFNIAITALKAKITPEESARITKWQSEILLIAGEFNRATLSSIDSGLIAAFGGATDKDKSAEALADWLPLILQIIELIIKLFGKG